MALERVLSDKITELSHAYEKAYSGNIPWIISLDKKPLETTNPWMQALMGNKGRGLKEMWMAGLPVPHGFIVTTEAWRQFYAYRDVEEKFRFVQDILQQNLNRAINNLEQETGCSFNDPENPLTVAVRSGAVFSMPGAMDTFLNVGVNKKNLHVVAEKIGVRNAVQAFIDLIIKFTSAQTGISKSELPQIQLPEFENPSVDNYKEAIIHAQNIYHERTGEDFPEDGSVQLQMATRFVFQSWFNEDAVAHRKQFRIPDECGTAVSVVEMKWGNSLAEGAGSGVAITMNTETLEDDPVISFAMHQQGTAVVGDVPQKNFKMADLHEPLRQELEKVLPTIHDKSRNTPKDIEFVFDGVKLWLLQVRDAHLSNPGYFRLLRRYINQGMLTPAQAIRRISVNQLDSLLRPPVNDEMERQAIKEGRLIATGQKIAPGYAYAPVVYSIDEAKEMEGPVILAGKLSLEMTTHIPENVIGIIAENEGIGSHTARRCEAIGNSKAIAVAFGVKLDPETVPKGTIITIDGDKGLVFRGEIPLQEDTNVQLTKDELSQVHEWLRLRRANPWLYLADESEKMQHYLDEAKKAWQEAQAHYLSQKARETYLLNALISPEIRNGRTIFQPHQINEIRSLLEKIIERGHHASIRTCHDPQLQGGGPWLRITSFDDIDRIFTDSEYSSKYGNYFKIIEDKDGSRVTEVLVGEVPKDNLSTDQEIQKQHGAWILNVTSDGFLAMQLLPHSFDPRGHEQLQLMTWISGPIRLQLKSFETIPDEKIFYSHWKRDVLAVWQYIMVVLTIKGWFSEYDLPLRLAAIASVFSPPEYGATALEGNIRIDPDDPADNSWVEVYGIKVDQMG